MPPPPPPHPRVEAPTDGLRFHSGVFKHGNKSDNPNGGCSGFTLEGGVRESLQNALGSKSWCHLLHKTKPPLPRRTAEVPEQCGQGRGGGRGFRRGTKKKKRKHRGGKAGGRRCLQPVQSNQKILQKSWGNIRENLSVLNN